MKILIIDDKKEGRYFLETLLKAHGFDVITAQNGKKALKMLEQQNIDLIMSDILMPEMDGFQFCKIVKNNESTKNIPFIFYTATYVEKKDEEFAMKLGADLFLRKPISPEILLDSIQDIITKIKQGTYTPRGIEQEEEKDIYKMYNQRLIKKLEHKIEQLEQEIERRTKAEEKLKTMVNEKEVLLKELYHRTRNNMHVIISMIRIYSSKLLHKKKDKMVIEDIDNKIRTMAMVHQKLYESHDLSHVNLKEYFESLIELLQNSYFAEKQKYSIYTNMEDIKVLLDTAIPMGFILNELITNALEHAFPKNKEGKIFIKLHKNKDNQIQLFVEDNGIGLLEDFDLEAKENVGLLLVSNMVRKQLLGHIEYKNENGLKWKIYIDQEYYSARV